jgi:hypothetical protein
VNPENEARVGIDNTRAKERKEKRDREYGSRERERENERRDWREKEETARG